MRGRGGSGAKKHVLGDIAAITIELKYPTHMGEMREGWGVW